MNQTTAASFAETVPDRLVSELLRDDPNLRSLVEEFVHGLTDRIGELRAAHLRQDWEQLEMLAHRLRGAAGSYGYPLLSQLGAAMEAEFRVRDAARFGDHLDCVARLADAARAALR